MTTKSIDQQSFYVAIALYESTSSNPEDRILYEECFVLIKATSLEQAKDRAWKLGRQQESSYKNGAGSTISWSLKHIVDVASVLDEGFEDGTELYSRHFRNYRAYYSFEPLLSGEPL